MSAAGFYPNRPNGLRATTNRQPTSEQNGYIESFNGKSGDELLDRELFYTLLEVRVLTERYRRTCNPARPHSSLGYRPPAPGALLPADPVPVLVGRT